MSDQSFEKLVEEAAAGLRSDPELFLDVKQELRCHLEEKAEHFAREGHSPEESVELARKALGTPMDLAGELLAGNRSRMRFRSLLRLTFGALVVPVAIVLALYVGYGRFARIQQMSGAMAMPGVPFDIPTLPFFGNNVRTPEQIATIRLLAGGQDRPGDILRYWKSHRRDEQSHIYYAYYAMYLAPKNERDYVKAMRMGERVEPENAFYNMLLAEFYLQRGIRAKSEKYVKPGETATDDLLDRRAFEMGMAEFRRGMQKTYLRTYQMQVLRKKLNAAPEPWLTEDYLQTIAISSAEQFPVYARARQVARKLGGCARILVSEGRNAEAKELLDLWKPYTRLLLSDSNSTMIHQLVTSAVASILTKEAAPVYEKLGAPSEALEARQTYKRMRQAREEWRSGDAERMRQEAFYRQHASQVATVMLPIFNSASVTAEELKPGRMHEHVMIEQTLVQVLLVILLLLMIGAIVQGAIWLRRLRRVNSIPLLLMPPTTVMMRALFFGLFVPVVVYAIYSRLPVIGGREFGLGSTMLPRFVTEWLILCILVLWIPARLIQRYIRRRCAELEIAVPKAKDQLLLETKMGVVLFAVFGGVGAVVALESIPTELRFFAPLIGLALIILTIHDANKKRAPHGLFYGTLARSMAPLYAFAIILLSLGLQPLLLQNEANWLRKDNLVMGYMAHNRDSEYGFSLVEQRAVESHRKVMLKVLGE